MNTCCNLYDFPLFKDCSRRSIDALLQSSSNRFSTYKEGELIALQGAPCRSLYLLLEGSVCAFMTNDEGKELTVERMKAPQILAPAFIYGSENQFPVSVKAIEDSKVWIVSKDSFFTALQENDKLLKNFLRVISDRSLFLSKKLKEFALESLSTRLVSYLEHHGQVQNLQEVAFILGVARPSLSRALALLLAQGVVRKEENGYKLAAK